MKIVTKLIVPVLALGLFVAGPAPIVRADDPPAAQPAKATGSISVRVVDADGKPVAGANITITAAAAKGKKKDKDPNAAKTKPDAVASGKTDANGLLTLPNIPEGTYRAQAKVKGGGTGKEDVIVTAPAAGADPATANPPVTITIQPKKAKEAPATQPA